jgi:hypothetical protein
VDGGRLPVIQMEYKIFTPEKVKPDVTIFIPEKRNKMLKSVLI